MELISIVEEFENYNLNQTKLDLEQRRLNSFFSVAVMNGKIKKPTQLYKFEWEKETRKILSKEEFDKIISDFGIPKMINN